MRLKDSWNASACIRRVWEPGDARGRPIAPEDAGSNSRHPRLGQLSRMRYFEPIGLVIGLLFGGHANAKNARHAQDDGKDPR